jgi:hypothetical protein
VDSLSANFHAEQPQRLLSIPERFPREVELHSHRDSLRIVLHPLESYVYREEFPASLALELLNISALVVTDSPLHQIFGSAEDASLPFDWFNLPYLNLSSDGKRELDRKDVLAINLSVLVIWARARPSELSGKNAVRSISRLRVDFIGVRIKPLYLSLLLAYQPATLFPNVLGCHAHIPIDHIRI